MARFKDPLTRQALLDIQQRNPRQPGSPQSNDLYAALCEIGRLRAMVLRANQLQRAFGDSVFGGGLTLVLEAFRSDLARAMLAGARGATGAVRRASNEA